MRAGKTSQNAGSNGPAPGMQSPGAQSDSEERYRSLISNLLDVVYVVRPDGTVTFASPQIARYGYSPDDVVYHNFIDFVAADCREYVLRKFAASLVRGETFPTDFKWLGKDGEVYWVQALGKTIYDKERRPLRQIGVIRDIGERKRAEKKLRDSETKFRNLVEQVNDWVWEIDAQGRYTYASPRVRELLGYEPNEVIGKTPFDLMPPGDAEKARAQFNPVFDAHEKLSHLENTLVRRDGGRVTVETSGLPIFDEGGAFVGYRGTDRDITERKRIEGALKKSETFLNNLFASIQDGISVLDADLTIVGVNPVMEKWYGAGIVGKKCYEVYHGRHRPCEKCPSIRAIREKTTQCEVVRDIRQWVEIYSFPYVNDAGEVTGVIEHVRDITERKRAEDEVLATRNMLQLIMNTIPQGIFWKDRRSTYMGCNRVFAKAAGLASPGEIIGKTDDDLPWSPEQTALFRAHDRAVMDNDAPEYHIVEQQREADGRLVWLETNKVPLHDAQGNVIGVLGTYEDVTERMRAEQALVDSEAKLNSIFRSAPSGIGVVVGRVITQVNEKLCAMTGYAREEMVDQNALMLYPTRDEYERAGRVKYEEIAKQGTGAVETQWRRKDGTVIDILLSSSPVVPGDLSGEVIFTALDITERKQAERALRESEVKFRLMADFTYDWESWISPGGNYVYVSPSCERITGHRADEFYGDPQLLMKLVHPDDRAAFEYHKTAHLNSASGESSTDFRIVTAGGEIRWISHHCVPVYGSDGEWLGRRASNRDITWRKQAEEELNDAKSQAELYLDLMGHDINNMHQIALGYLEVAKDKMSPECRGEFLDKPIEVLHRSARLIRNVRKLQKLQDGVFQAQKIDVCAVLTDVRREFGAVPGKSVTLDLHGQEHCHVLANELLYDVFSNLVVNAIKHAKGMAAIAIDLDVVQKDGGRYCQVTVEDNGPGVPDDQKGVIFNRTLRGTDKSKGMGLGLYLVKSLVDSYGGRVWVEDRVPGDHMQGAKFIVLLPAVE